MALSMKSRTPVRFELNDGLVETTITLYADDSEQLLVEKLKRVVALSEGRPAPLSVTHVSEPAPAPQTGNGWAGVVQTAPPELPEDRKAEWEYMPPEVSDSGV
jgi:hypothetical protein